MVVAVPVAYCTSNLSTNMYAELDPSHMPGLHLPLKYEGEKLSYH